MTYSSFKLHVLLGLAVVGAVLSDSLDRPLSSSASSDEKTEGASHNTRHRRSADLEFLTQEQRIAFLKTHNKIRSDATGVFGHTQPTAAGMMRMYWSAELEASAVSWSMTCPPKGGNPHGQTDITKAAEFLSAVMAEDGFIGQNAERSTPIPNATAMILGFGAETQFFTFNEGADGTCVVGKKCGHYTQVMWQTSFLVGCGYAKCGDLHFNTCNYSPGGNLEGSEPYKSGAPCSLCSSYSKYGFTECEENLCVPKDRCSPVKTCTVVDKENCLCSQSSYEETVTRLVTGATGPTGANGAIHVGSPVIVHGLLLPLVAILLGHGVQLGYDDPELQQQL